MTMNISTGTLGAATPAAGAFPAHHAYYVREFIEIANPLLIYKNFGGTKPIEKNTGNTMVFSKVNKLAKDNSGAFFTLAEGVTPVAQQFQMTRVTHSVGQYGGYAITTDRITDESINGITSEFNKRLAEQAGEVMNGVIRDNLLGGSQARFANGVGTRDGILAATTADQMETDLAFIYLALRKELVKPFNPHTKGSTNIGTTPMFEAYPIIVPLEAIPLIEALVDGAGHKFIHAKDYASQRALWPNEYGMYKQFAFILDTESKFVTNAAATPQNIALCPVFGKDAYLVTPVGTGDAEVIVKPLGSAGTTDPLNQRASIGWKARNGAVIVQQTYMWRYELSLGAA
jgi:N4-gp56 family major capsid protein